MNNELDCRSALFMPASNEKALKKGPILPADAIIVDLEDSVAPNAKAEARQSAIKALGCQDYGYRIRALRINDASTPWFHADVQAAASCTPDVIVFPKVDTADDIATLCRVMADEGVHGSTHIWAMIESPTAVMSAGAIAASKVNYPSLHSLLIGNNDIARVARMPVQSDRTYLIPWLMTLVAAARSHGLGLLDGVYNDFADHDGFLAECEQGRTMGMDGKMLIHPSQISTANTVFSPSPDALDKANRIVEIFQRPENSDKGAIAIKGQMVERLHFDMALALLERAKRLASRA